MCDGNYISERFIIITNSATRYCAKTSETKMTYKKSITAIITLSMIGSAALVSADETTGRKTYQKPQLSEIDVNGDSLISKLEFLAHTKTRFDKADTDGDGALSSDELLLQISTKASARVQKMINRADTNADGLLGFDELETARSKGRGSNMFNKLDTDNDGQLNQEEFSKVKKRGGKGKKRGKRACSNNGDGND
jgi:hypothetical protein